MAKSAVRHGEAAYDTGNGRAVSMRRVLWVVGFLAAGLVLGFVVRLVWPHRPGS